MTLDEQLRILAGDDWHPLRNAPPHEAPEHDPEPHRVDNEAAHDAWQERNGL